VGVVTVVCKSGRARWRRSNAVVIVAKSYLIQWAICSTVPILNAHYLAHVIIASRLWLFTLEVCSSSSPPVSLKKSWMCKIPYTV
jgi:hypothetical protein